MRRSTLASRSAAVATLVLAAALHCDAARPPQCAIYKDGDAAVRQVEVILKKAPRIVMRETRTLDETTGQQTYAIDLRKGSGSMLETRVDIGTDGSAVLTRRLGKGFKGIHEVQVRSGPAGDVVTVDGHVVSTSALETTPPSIVFEDGTPSPALRIASLAKRIVRKAQKAKPTCPSSAGSVPHVLVPAAAESIRVGTSDVEYHNPFDPKDACEGCVDRCWGEALICFASGIGELVKFISNSKGCGGALEDCIEVCKAPGEACCDAFCGDACCGRNARAEDILCVGAKSDFAGKCCPRGSECGDNCCYGEASVCADPVAGVCCRPGENVCGTTCCPGNCAGNACCGASEGCGSWCCTPDEPRCAVPSDVYDDVVCIDCPVDKTGPVCGFSCCGPGEICDNLNQCCAPGETCGGTCCDPQHCLNGTTCCAPPSGVCGNQCCGPLEQCCNGQCCGGDDLCVAGSCCPRNQECGATCCPDGYACSDRDAGTCVPCGTGEEACPFSPGSPITCCATGTECCTEECCAPGMQCCRPPGSAEIGCHPPEACVL